MKSVALRSFQLTTKSYRKRFREYTGAPGRTYAETEIELDRRFLKWLKTEEVETFEDLKQLMVVEKFMSLLHPEARLRIIEAGIRNLRAAADRTDILETFSSQKGSQPRRPGQ